MTFLKQLIRRHNHPNTADNIRPRTRNRFELDYNTQTVNLDPHSITETLLPKPIEQTTTDFSNTNEQLQEIDQVENTRLYPPPENKPLSITPIPKDNTDTANKVEKQQAKIPLEKEIIPTEKFNKSTLLIEEKTPANIPIFKKKETIVSNKDASNKKVEENNPITPANTNTYITNNTQNRLVKPNIIRAVFPNIENKQHLQIKKNSTTPTIKVSIGKIEVKALSQREKPKPIRKKRPIAKPHLSLEDYLKK